MSDYDMTAVSQPAPASLFDPYSNCCIEKSLAPVSSREGVLAFPKMGVCFGEVLH